MIIAGFDIGIKNFAFVVLNIKESDEDIENKFDVIHCENMNLQSSSTKKVRANDMDEIYRNLYQVLDTFRILWDDCNIFLIEQQMQYRHASNIKALKLSQHVLSYFYIHYSKCKIMEYPAYHKTQVWKAPLKMTKYQRKRWAVNKVKDILEKKEQGYLLEDVKKKDDISDCILMVLSYVMTTYNNNHV